MPYTFKPNTTNCRVFTLALLILLLFWLLVSIQANRKIVSVDGFTLLLFFVCRLYYSNYLLFIHYIYICITLSLRKTRKFDFSRKLFSSALPCFASSRIFHDLPLRPSRRLHQYKISVLLTISNFRIS